MKPFSGGTFLLEGSKETGVILLRGENVEDRLFRCVGEGSGISGSEAFFSVEK